MTDIPHGEHSGSVTATGWRRDNHDLVANFTYATQGGGQMRVSFNWRYKRQFFQKKRVFNTIILPTLGPGWNDRWGVFRFDAGPTQIKFTSQMISDANGTGTFGLKTDDVAMMHDFFAHQTSFLFEMHGPEGLQMALPMTNDPTTYVALTEAVERSLS